LDIKGTKTYCGLLEGSLNLGLATYRKSVSETKRAAILKAAREIFLKDGYSRAAMAEIAREADVSTATLYKHFDSKESLFAAVVQDAYRETDSSMFVDIAGKSARTVLRNIAALYTSQQFEGRMNDLLRVVIAEVPSAPDLARDVYQNSVLDRYSQLQATVDELVARGDLRPHDTSASIRHLAGMVKEFVVWPGLFSLGFTRPDDMDAKIDACIEAYMKIYGARPQASGTSQEDTIGT
jgi:TetR/AcrR family transcriptional regulator of autoinduction and epiphytic fitness